MSQVINRWASPAWWSRLRKKCSESKIKGMAEIISAFLEREKEDKKIFIILSMVIVQAVQAYFQFCKSDNIFY